MTCLLTWSHWNFTMHQSILPTILGLRRRICDNSTCGSCRCRWLLALLINLIILWIFNRTCWWKVGSWIVHWIFGLSTWLSSSWRSWYLCWWLGLLWIIWIYYDLPSKFWTHPSFVLARSYLIFESIAII